MVGAHVRRCRVDDRDEERRARLQHLEQAGRARLGVGVDRVGGPVRSRTLPGEGHVAVLWWLGRAELGGVPEQGVGKASDEGILVGPVERVAGLEGDDVAAAQSREALAHLDARLVAAQKALAAAQRQLKQVAEASRQGNLRDLPRLLEGGDRRRGAALFQVNARGAPVEFTYNRLDLPSGGLWRPEQLEREAAKALARSLFEAAPDDSRQTG